MSKGCIPVATSRTVYFEPQTQEEMEQMTAVKVADALVVK